MELQTNIRSLVKAEGEDIVVEVFKDSTGKILRQQSFTLEQLNTQKAQITKTYNDGLAKVNTMIDILKV